MAGNDYADVGWWATELISAVIQNESGYVVDFLRNYDLMTGDGIKDLSSAAIDALQNNLVPTPQDAVNLWQASQCLKKFKYGCTASPEEMMSGWIKRNARCAEPLELPAWVLDEMKRLLAPLGPAFDATEDTQGRFGNGAVYEGYTGLARWNAIWTFPYNVRWPDRICWWSRSSCDTARLCCVPKDMFKLRSITVEPAEATFLQQYYRSRLIAAAAEVLPRNSGIPQQAWGAGPEVQRSRAQRGSLTGALATLDLSDASDSVRWDVVSYVFPSTVVAALERARSTYTEVNGTRYRNHMFAGMGNATTFIVESLYFWGLLTVLARWLRDKIPVSVFGDDIVVSTELANHPLFQEMLAKAGLILNMAKSGLSRAPGFREACGLVAYKGHELPLLRISGYREEQPEELVSMLSLISEGLAPSSRYAPFVKGLMANVGQHFRAKHPTVPVVPLPLQREGWYLVDPDMLTGQWKYRARWDPSLQHPCIRIHVAEPRRGKTFRAKHVTRGEANGILNGQLQTAFRDLPAGSSSRYTTFKLPGRGFKWAKSWVACWGSGPELVDLLDDDSRTAGSDVSLD